jgi:transposase
MATNVNPTDIDHQICELYVENSMSVGMVRKWVRKVNEGYDNVQEEKRSGRP